MFTVKISQKNGPEQVLNFSGGEIHIGRVGSNEIVLPKSNISKRHALLTHSSGGLAITDTKSTNGTFVNGERISGVCDLCCGDKIYLGEFTVEVLEIESKPAAERRDEPSRVETKSQPNLDSISIPNDPILSDDWGANGEISDSWTGDWKSQTAQAKRDSAAVEPLDMARGYPTIDPDIEAPDDDQGVIIPPAPATATTPMAGPTPYIDGASTASVVENPRIDQSDLDLDAPELSFGPLKKLMANPAIRRIDINQPGRVFADGGQGAEATDLTLQGSEIESLLDSLLKQVGQSLRTLGPLFDFSLPDGTRIQGTLPPIALYGPNMTVHKRTEHPQNLDELVSSGSLSKNAATFLRQCVCARYSIAVVSPRDRCNPAFTLGPLAKAIQNDVRIITVEETAQLKLPQPQVISLCSGAKDTSTNEVLKHAIAMKPGYLILGESASGQSSSLMFLAETGHRATLASIYALNIDDAVNQLSLRAKHRCNGNENLAKTLLQSAVDVLVFQETESGGKTVVTGIYELNDAKPTGIFTRTAGQSLTATGTVPSFCSDKSPGGVQVDSTIFEPA